MATAPIHNIYRTDSERNLDVMAKRAIKQHLKDTYDADILRRSVQKKQKEDLSKAQDLLMLKMNERFSPWGRGGGGAPLRSEGGDVISDLTQVYNAERLPVEAPLSPPANSVNALIRSNYNDINNNPALQQNGSRVLQDALVQRLEERHKSIREAFLASDRDRSGYLDGHEIKRLCKLYNLETSQVNNVLKSCDIDYNGMISYDEFCQTLVRKDYPAGGGSYSPTQSSSSQLSPVRIKGDNSPTAHRRQQRQGATSPTTLSPPYLANLTGGRSPLGPSDDGALPYNGDPYNTNPTTNNGQQLSPGGTTVLWPKKLTKSSPKAGTKGASFYVEAPATPQRLNQERKRRNLIAGLDSQVAQRKQKRDQEELANLRSTLLSQQRLINEGKDYWGQPIPDGDPRGTARLMAVNTLEKMEDVGLSPESSPTYKGKGQNPTAYFRRDDGNQFRSRSTAGKKPYEDHSYGGGSGPSSGTAMPFMSSLASMNGPSPEEKKRRSRKQKQLQHDLAHQVRVTQVEKGNHEIIQMREELKSRQKKLDNNLDNWSQKLPENDPFGVGRSLRLQQDTLRRNINEKEMFLEGLEIQIEKSNSPKGKDRNNDRNNRNDRGGDRSNTELERMYDLHNSHMMDDDGIDIIPIEQTEASSPSNRRRRQGEQRKVENQQRQLDQDNRDSNRNNRNNRVENNGNRNERNSNPRNVPTFESTPMGMSMPSTMTNSPSRDPYSFTLLPDASSPGPQRTDGGHRLGNRRAANIRKEKNQKIQIEKFNNSNNDDMTYVDSIEKKLRNAIRGAMMTETAMRHLFVQFDKIGSGKISKYDFQRGFSKLGIVDATENEIDSLIRRLDRTGDGYIDYLEFVRIAVRGVRHAGVGRRKGPKRPSGKKPRNAASAIKRRVARRKPAGKKNGGVNIIMKDLNELMMVVKELRNEQDALKRNVRRQGQVLGFPGTPEV